MATGNHPGAQRLPRHDLRNARQAWHNAPRFEPPWGAAWSFITTPTPPTRAGDHEPQTDAFHAQTVELDRRRTGATA